jgi:hypothetical protein
MIALATDSSRLISLMVHTGAGLSEPEVLRVLANIDAFANAVAKRPNDFATTIIIVETDNGPNAAQRKRIGEAAKRIPRSYQALVTRSAVVRAIMTAIRWFSPADANNHQQSFSTFAEARDWLVARTGHAATVLDALHAEARAELRRAGDDAGLRS